MHLEASDPTFIDALITPNAGRNDRLDRIDRLIDWPKVAAILDDIHGFVDELNGIGGGFSFSKDFVLKASLTLLDRDVRFKVENFNKAHVDQFQSEWEDIKTALRRSVLLVEGFGFSAENLSSNNALLPIAYYLYLQKTDPRDSDKRAIRLWLIRSLLKRGVWSSGFDSLLNALRPVIKNNGAARFPKEEIEAAMASRGKSLEFSDEELQGLAKITIHDGRVFPLLTLLFDFVDLADNKFHIDHVFPHVKFGTDTLRHFRVPDEQHERYKDMRDRLPNLQLLKGKKNVQKQAVLPSEWLNRQYPGDARQAYEERHLLGDVAEGLDEFDAFYEARRNRLEEKIRQLLGYAED